MVIISTRRYGTHRITTVPTKPGTPITTGKNPITTQVTLKPTTTKVSTPRVGVRNTPQPVTRKVTPTPTRPTKTWTLLSGPPKAYAMGNDELTKTHNPSTLINNETYNPFGTSNYNVSQQGHINNYKRPPLIDTHNTFGDTADEKKKIAVERIKAARDKKSGSWTSLKTDTTYQSQKDEFWKKRKEKEVTFIGSGVGSGARIIAEQNAKKTGTIIDTNLGPFKTNQINDIRMDNERLEKIYKQQRLNNVKQSVPQYHTNIQNFDLLIKNDFKLSNRKIKDLPLVEDFLSGYNTGKKVDEPRTVYTMNKDTNKLELVPEATRKVYKKTYTADEAMNLANPKISYNFDAYEKMYTDRLPRQNDAWYI